MSGTNGYTEILAPIRPKNNANFPILSAEHISISTTDDTRLSELLSGLNGNIETYVQRVVDQAASAFDQTAVTGRIADNEEAISQANLAISDMNTRLDSIENQLTDVGSGTKNFKLDITESDATMSLLGLSNKPVQTTDLASGNFYVSGRISCSGGSILTIEGSDLSITTDKNDKVLDYYDAEGCKTFQKNVYAPNIDALQTKVDEMYTTVQALKAINSI